MSDVLIDASRCWPSVLGIHVCDWRLQLHLSLRTREKCVSVFFPLDKLVDFGANWHFVLIPVVSGS